MTIRGHRLTCSDCLRHEDCTFFPEFVAICVNSIKMRINLKKLLLWWKWYQFLRRSGTTLLDSTCRSIRIIIRVNREFLRSIRCGSFWFLNECCFVKKILSFLKDRKFIIALNNKFSKNITPKAQLVYNNYKNTKLFQIKVLKYLM